MAKRFSSGIPGLLQGLMWVQREAATGTMGLAGSDDGKRLVFRGGILLGVEAGDGAAPEGNEDALRTKAQGLMEDWGFSDSLLVFSEGEADLPPDQAAGRINAADLILDVVKRDADPRWVKKRLGSDTGKVSNPETLPKILPRVAMTPTEAFLLSRADGTLSFAEILQVSPMAPGEVTLALYALLTVGLLSAPGARLPGEKSGTVPPPASPPAAPEAEAPASVQTPPTPAADPPPPAKAVNALDDFLARTAAPGSTREESPAPAESAPAPPAPPEEAGSYARSPEMETLRREVLEWIGSSAGMDHYRILQIDRTADESMIRRAYYRLAKKFHPDKFRRPGFEEMLQDVEKMFAATTEAYNTLTDDRGRADYEKEIDSRSKGRGKESDLAAQARDSYLRAKKHIEAEEFFDAASYLEAACRLDGSKADYWLLLGSVQEKNPKWRRKAEASYNKVIEINPTSADAYLHLARLYRAGGLQRRAMEMFKKVVEWDPQNEEAQAGLSGKDGTEGDGVKGRIRSIFKGSRS